MAVKIKMKKYYRTAEVCQAAGISKPTFFRRLREGTFVDARRRDMRGWRLFTREELDSIVLQAKRINEGE
jgi:AcrR family transcriptional regulator